MSFLVGRRGLYAIVDPDQTAGRSPLLIAEALLAAGPVALQLRMKSGNDAEILALARAIRPLARASAVPFVMNDRADLARLVDADALHLGQDDLPIDAARALVGSMPIGVSTHSLADAEAAVRAGADSIGFGPVFATTSKRNADPTVGLEGLAEVVRFAASAGIPVVAIGGITEERVSAVRASGASIAAVIGAVGLAHDPAAAARALHSLLVSPG